MARAIRHPLGVLILGTLAALGTGVAIFAFGAPPWVLVPVAWGGALLFGAALTWIDRHAPRER